MLILSDVWYQFLQPAPKKQHRANMRQCSLQMSWRTKHSHFRASEEKWYEKRRSDASITTTALILIFQSAKIDFNVIFLWLFMHLHPKISAFVVITVPYLHFSYHFLPRRESANVLFATWYIVLITRQTHRHAYTIPVIV